MRRGTAHTLPALLCLATFVAAGAGDVYGLHRCAHHDAAADPPVPAGHADERDASDDGHPVPSRHAHPGHVATGAAQTGPVGVDHGQHDRHGEHGPCTCVGDCHAGAATPVALRPQSSEVVTPGPLRSAGITTGDEPFARIAVPYLLHQPNAPPLPA